MTYANVKYEQYNHLTLKIDKQTNEPPIRELETQITEGSRGHLVAEVISGLRDDPRWPHSWPRVDSRWPSRAGNQLVETMATMRQPRLPGTCVVCISNGHPPRAERALLCNYMLDLKWSDCCLCLRPFYVEFITFE